MQCTKNILARERKRYCLGLDRGRHGELFLRNSLKQSRIQAKRGKAGSAVLRRPRRFYDLFRHVVVIQLSFHGC